MTKAKKSLASENKITLGAEDKESSEERIKFVCELQGHVFVLPVFDDKGKPVYKVDSQGNRTVQETKSYEFTMVSGRDASTNKMDPKKTYCFFVVDPVKHGGDYGRILSYLINACKNPRNKMYREDDHWKKHNPEAFRIAEEKRAMSDEIEKKDALLSEQERKIKSLEAKLGLRK